MHSHHPTITLPIEAGPFDVMRLTGTERVSGLFSFDVDILPSNPVQFDPSTVSAESLIGREALITLPGDPSGVSAERYIHGVIGRFSSIPMEEASEEASVSVGYRFRLVPWLALWDLKSNFRMFTDLSVPDIAEIMIGEWGGEYEDWLHDSYVTRVYCCQFEETDFNFLTRLLEDEGIFYYFEHYADKHRLVLADKNYFNAMHGTPTATYGYGVTHWSAEYSMHAGRYTTRDFDVAQAETIEASEATLIDVPGNSRLHMIRFPAGSSLNQEVRRRARVGMEREERRHVVFHGVSRRHDFCAGGKFALQEHSDERWNAEYLLTSVRHSFDPRDGYRNSFTCIPDHLHISYRPPRTAAKPTVPGIQTAIVVDDKLDPDGSGAIQVRFHWSDVPSACWVRVAEMTAGHDWGTRFPPRVGQEVIVEFLNGDPDRPVITGRLYNGENRIPEIDPDITLIRTIRGQELRFDDRNGQERLLLKAANDLEILAEKGELTIQDGSGNRIHISPQKGISITSSGEVQVQASQVKVSAGIVTIDAGITRASGVVQCDMLITNAVVSASYTPGAGNIW